MPEAPNHERWSRRGDLRIAWLPDGRADRHSKLWVALLTDVNRKHVLKQLRALI